MFILYVLLLASDGSSQSRWIGFDRESECRIKASAQLQNLTLDNGKPATAWVVDCLPLEQATQSTRE